MPDDAETAILAAVEKLSEAASEALCTGPPDSGAAWIDGAFDARAEAILRAVVQPPPATWPPAFPAGTHVYCSTCMHQPAEIVANDEATADLRCGKCGVVVATLSREVPS